MSIWRALQLAEVETHRQCDEASQLWSDGLGLIWSILQSLSAYKFVNPSRDTVLATLLSHAWNTQFAGYRLASAGLYAPALCLVRICAEHWLAWWYVNNFPDEAPRFLRTDAPTWNVMFQRLEKRHETPLFTPTKGLYKWLHKLAHVGRPSIAFTLSDDSIALGP
jgi:hypothetical protein